MIFKSLRSRIIISIIGIVVISLAITTFFFQHKAKYELSEAIEANARNLLKATKYHVESQHNSILYYQSALLSRRKIELKNNTTIAFAIIQSAYQKYKSGLISETAAKQDAKKTLEQLRYDEGTGYFWVNDTQRPFPRMIMHPTIPELDGTILDNPEFNCALGRNENLFKAFVDVSLDKGEGFVDYLWPKPLTDGLTQQQPKISYVKLFKPWNWIIGSGVYIDDIEKDIQDRIDAVIKDLNKTIMKQRIGKSGYFFIFNRKNQLLVHPSLAGTDGNLLINPETGTFLFDELKQIADSPEPFLEYLWDKPAFRHEYRFPKKAFVTLYKPLGWYIASTVYKEDFEQKISELVNSMLLFFIIFLILAIIISLSVSRSIVKPLNQLIHSINQTDKDGFPINMIPETGTTELKVLSATMNNMINQIRISRKELKSQRDFSLDFINHAPYIICGMNSEGVITFVNPSGEEKTGHSKDEIIGKNWWRLFYPGDEYQQVETLFKNLAGGDITNYEMTLVCKNGEKKYIVWNSYSKIDKNTNKLEIIGFGNDITDRKRAEQDLKKAQNYISNIIDSMPSLLIGVDKNGKVTQWNKTAEKATGVTASDAQGKTLSDVFPQMALEMEKITESIRTCVTNREQKRPRLSDNGTRYEDVTIYPLVANGAEGVVIRIDDVTEQVRLEEMMIQSEKMVSVGGLAAGMAHEINNPLGVMMALAQTIERRFSKEVKRNSHIAQQVGIDLDRLNEYMERREILNFLGGIREAGIRAAKIVRNMLDFSRKSESLYIECSVAEMLDKAIDMASTDYDLKKKYDFRSIQIDRQYDTKLPVVNVIETEIGQVFLNLFKNAAQAMSEKTLDNMPPKIILRTHQDNDWVQIEVEDNGPGIDSTTQKRIFEPFFTTKSVGTGTGLGLSVSYFIITKNHKGEFFVESNLNLGTKFIIRLPIVS